MRAHTEHLEGEALLRRLTDPSRKLYSIAEPSRSTALLSKHAGLEAIPLFSGYAKVKFGDSAPCLLRLRPVDPQQEPNQGPEPGEREALLNAFLASTEIGWWFESGAYVRHLIRHARDLLAARMPDGSLSLFRYYDPRILRIMTDMDDHTLFSAIFGEVISTVYLPSREERGGFEAYRIQP